ncbi:MAG: PAS domain S-box-containing protein [Verrucomicrobiales bacterium]|jgi:PAS domain S-box-containing protein
MISHSSSDLSGSARRLVNRIPLYTALTLTLVCLTVALVSIIPSWTHFRQSELTQFKLVGRLHAQAIGRMLEKKKDAAQQVAGSTGGRQLLEAFQRGEYTIEEVRTSLSPILNDALRHSLTLTGVARQDRNGREIVALGEQIPESARFIPEGSSASIGSFLEISGHTRLVVGTPIITLDGVVIGSDLTLFRSDEIERVFAEAASNGKSGELRLVSMIADEVRQIYPIKQQFSDRDSGLIDFDEVVCALNKEGDGCVVQQKTEEIARIVVIQPVPGIDWALVGNREQQAFFARSSAQSLQLVGVALALIAIGLAGMLLLLRPIIGQIKREIERRRDAEAELRAYQETLEQRIDEGREELRFARYAMDHTSEAVYLVDSEARFRDVNQAACKALGYSRKELLTVGVFDIHAEFSAEEFGDGWKSLPSGESRSIETHHRRKNGEIFPVEVLINRMEYQDEAYHLVFARDISERREAERNLNSSHECFRSLMRNIPGIVHRGLPDEDRTMLIVGEGVSELTGYTAKEYLEKNGITPAHSIHPDDRKRVRVAIESSTGDSEGFNLEYRMLHRDGSTLWVHERGRVINDDSSEPLYVDSAILDITQRKLAEHLLAEQAERMKVLNEIVADGAPGDVDSLLLAILEFCVDKLELDFGILGRAEEAGSRLALEIAFPSASHTIESSLHGTLCEMTFQRDQPTAMKSLSQSAHCKLVHQQGIESFLGVPLFVAGTRWGVLCFASSKPQETEFSALDFGFVQMVGQLVAGIIGRREDRAELVTAKVAAEFANHAKSAFLANMSHEIRTPMNAVLGFSQLLRNDRTLSPNQLQYIEAVSRSGEHLLTLINDILEMSKIEAGRCPLHVAPYHLWELVDDLAIMFGRQAEEKGVEINIEMARDLPPWVVGDEKKLRQVLVNLLSNSVKFTNKGGIDLSVAWQDIGDDRIRLTFEVEDTGIGIPKGEVERIFDAFEQTAAGALCEGSTGLGLAISRNYVRMMGGEIDVKSEEGRGSAFGFTIEVGRAPERLSEQLLMQSSTASAQISDRLAEADLGSGVLVVDDNAANRRLLVDILKPIGFDVREACTGVEAISALENWTPRVILMDTRMPEMDGIEATRRIKATDSGKAVPIIGISASAFVGDAQRVIDAGSCEYLRKPFLADDVIEAIRRHAGVQLLPAPTDGAEVEEKPLVLEALSEDLVGRLRTVTVARDADAILELSDEIAEHDNRAGETIREMASNFRFEEIRAALDA